MIEVIVKVTRDYRVTIPRALGRGSGIKVGDLIRVIYDEGEGVVKLIPVRRSRTTIRLGRPITVEEIEGGAIEDVMGLDRRCFIP